MLRLVLLAALALSLTGCRGAWYAHRFLPAPLEVQVGPEGSADAQARVLITVLGIRRPDRSVQRPAQVEVRMQLENLGRVPARLETQSLGLVASDLIAFGPASMSPETVESLATGERALYDISFPLPAGRELGDLDLRGVHLTWTVAFEELRATTGVTFERRTIPSSGDYGPAYHPYYWPYPYYYGCR